MPYGKLQTEDPWDEDNNCNLDKSDNGGRWVCCVVQFYPWFKFYFPLIKGGCGNVWWWV